MLVAQSDYRRQLKKHTAHFCICIDFSKVSKPIYIILFLFEYYILSNGVIEQCFQDLVIITVELLNSC